MSDEVEDVELSADQDDIAEVSPVEEQQAPEPVQQEQPQDVWQNFRNMPEFNGQEDMAIARRLYEAMQREEASARALQQYQSIMPVAQDYLRNRPDYEKWLASRNAPTQPEPPKQEEKPWWNPPQIKESYKRYLTRDEQGREIIDPNAPMDARSALEEYQQFRADFAQKFLDNPEQALGPMVERVAVQRAEQIVGEKLQRMQDEQYVSSIEQENKDWLYDQNGNVSAEGAAVQKYIQDAKSIGINGAQARWEYASRMVERDLLLATMRQMNAPQAQVPQSQPQQPQVQQPQQPTVEQQNMEYLRQQAMRTASRRSTGATTARVPEKPMTFGERLLSIAQDEGYFTS